MASVLEKGWLLYHNIPWCHESNSEHPLQNLLFLLDLESGNLSLSLSLVIFWLYNLKLDPEYLCVYFFICKMEVIPPALPTHWGPTIIMYGEVPCKPMDYTDRKY